MYITERTYQIRLWKQRATVALGAAAVITGGVIFDKTGNELHIDAYSVGKQIRIEVDLFTPVNNNTKHARTLLAAFSEKQQFQINYIEDEVSKSISSRKERG